MDAGAPMPAIQISDSGLFVAYIVSEPSLDGNLENYAVVQFSNVLQHTFGYPNDEALGMHPLYQSGLTFYAFNEVLNSPYVADLANRNEKQFPGSKDHYLKFRHWIVTFHDETLEVIGLSAKVIGSIGATSGAAAISSLNT